MSATLHALARSGLVLAGMLLLGVGVADLAVGGAKVVQYREIVHSAPPAAPLDPSALFPTATEAEQQHAVARAKIGYYQIMVTAGRLLVALGVVLVACGVLQTRYRLLRASLVPRPSN